MNAVADHTDFTVGRLSIKKTRILVKAALSGEKDKSGVSKYDHCCRVEQHAIDLIQDFNLPDRHADIRIVALMHDLLEDSDLDRQDLIDLKYSEEIVQAVELLTHDEAGSYAEYIDRLCASGNYLAIVGKLADNRDNTDPKRYVGLDEDFAAYLNKRYGGVRPKLETALKGLLAQ